MERRDYNQDLFEAGAVRLMEVGAAVLAGILVCVLLSGCVTTKYIPVETVRAEVVEKHDSLVMRDSIYLRDSVYVIKSGDTITTYKTSIVYRDRWRDVVRVDSFMKTDTIRVPYPVEKELSKWERLKMSVGGISLTSCFILFLLLIVGVVSVKKRNQK